MTDQSGSDVQGWKIVQSAAMEMDAALAIAGGSFPRAGLTADIKPLQDAPEDWKALWSVFFKEMTWYSSILENIAEMAGVLDEPDYSRATMAIRGLTVEAAIRRMQELTSDMGVEEPAETNPEKTLRQLFIRYRRSAYEKINLIHPKDQLYENRLTREIQFCFAIIQGGKSHDEFWHWLDQFYYGIYQPWRESRRAFMGGLEQRVVTMLADNGRGGKRIDLSWLPEMNLALRYPEIKTAVENRDLFINFWLEPFGFADTYALMPGAVYMSFAEPGQMYENFLAYSKNLAAQAQALADPTRLIILRLIRVMSMTNTDMAAYLGLSRPTVSIHARVLREAGLINSWEEGRITRHEINPDAVRKLFSELEAFLDLPAPKQE